MLQFFSVFDFIEESMPQLKREQQLAMRAKVEACIDHVTADTIVHLINEWMPTPVDEVVSQQDYDAMLQTLRNEFMRFQQVVICLQKS